MALVADEVPGVSGTRVYLNKDNLVNIGLASEQSAFLGTVSSIYLGSYNLLTVGPRVIVNMGTEIRQNFGDVFSSFCDSFSEYKINETTSNIAKHVCINEHLLAGGVDTKYWKSRSLRNKKSKYMLSKQIIDMVLELIGSIMEVSYESTSDGVLEKYINKSGIRLPKVDRFPDIFKKEQFELILKILFYVQSFAADKLYLQHNLIDENLMKPLKAVANILFDSRGIFSAVYSKSNLQKTHMQNKSDIRKSDLSPTAMLNLLCSEQLPMDIQKQVLNNFLKEKLLLDPVVLELVSQLDDKTYAGIYKTPQSMFLISKKDSLHSANISLESDNNNDGNGKGITIMVENESCHGSMLMTQSGTDFYREGSKQKFHAAVLCEELPENCKKELKQSKRLSKKIYQEIYRLSASCELILTMLKNLHFEIKETKYGTWQELRDALKNQLQVIGKDLRESDNQWNKIDYQLLDLPEFALKKDLKYVDKQRIDLIWRKNMREELNKVYVHASNMAKIEIKHENKLVAINEKIVLLNMQLENLQMKLNPLRKEEQLSQLLIDNSSVMLTISENRHGFYADNKGLYLVSDGESALKHTVQGFSIYDGAIKFSSDKKKLNLTEDFIIKNETNNMDKRRKSTNLVVIQNISTIATDIKDKVLKIELHLNYIRDNVVFSRAYPKSVL